jgi:hypothetical protein
MTTRSMPTTLGPMPRSSLMTTIDEQLFRAPVARAFALGAEVERWPEYLAHYRYVTMIERDGAGGGLVEMSANRPFGVVAWPTWWTSEMEVRGLDAPGGPAVRFKHVRGITAGMDVEWTFTADSAGTRVRIVHMWNGPRWPVIGATAARRVIGPVFVHGIASRTLAGLARAAER